LSSLGRIHWQRQIFDLSIFVVVIIIIIIMVERLLQNKGLLGRLSSASNFGFGDIVTKSYGDIITKSHDPAILCIFQNNTNSTITRYSTI
jgi:hypothetical protein